MSKQNVNDILCYLNHFQFYYYFKTFLNVIYILNKADERIFLKYKNAFYSSENRD